MKRIDIYLFSALLLCSCTDVLIPHPTPLVSEIQEYSCEFPINELLYKTDPVTKNIYVESWATVNDSYYVPYMQCISPEGRLKWDNWIKMTSYEGRPFINLNIFDVTSDGHVINIFSARKEGSKEMVPYITKISPDGKEEWGKNGIMFYELNPYATGTEFSPTEGMVAADNKGGAWVVACNSLDQLVVRRVSSIGEMSEPIIFTNGEKRFIRRPQLLVNDRNELFMIVQLANQKGGGGTQTILEGHVDVIKISEDGRVLSQNVLMSERKFYPGLRAEINQDSKGGAYVMLRSGVSSAHQYVYHFNSEGIPDTPEADIRPAGYRGVIGSQTVVCPGTDQLVVLTIEKINNKCSLSANSVDLDGKVLWGDQGVTLLNCPDDAMLSTSIFKAMVLKDTSVYLSFLYQPIGKYDLLYGMTMYPDGTTSEPEAVLEIDRIISSGGTSDCEFALIDGCLRHIWYNRADQRFMGYLQNIEQRQR